MEMAIDTKLGKGLGSHLDASVVSEIERMEKDDGGFWIHTKDGGVWLEPDEYKKLKRFIRSDRTEYHARKKVKP